ncbi:uncharacterized protein TRIREDRAFT_112603 [Trichoderma reesei QM6a]|uniref:Predicted protein n=1 Tax=Hypocrea jecorina (strain QM6a) TaxID=431241 RepID=G0RXH4_HYPJQ|nr:uncharacterized protein TRIREDRAFT_112603 [Trichoderma reesei QM6a]EGR44115.1 predicted protein [Trichoderma reesei QM6a]
MLLSLYKQVTASRASLTLLKGKACSILKAASGLLVRVKGYKAILSYYTITLSIIKGNYAAAKFKQLYLKILNLSFSLVYLAYISAISASRNIYLMQLKTAAGVFKKGIKAYLLTKCYIQLNYSYLLSLTADFKAIRVRKVLKCTLYIFIYYKYSILAVIFKGAKYYNYRINPTAIFITAAFSTTAFTTVFITIFTATAPITASMLLNSSYKSASISAVNLGYYSLGILKPLLALAKINKLSIKGPYRLNLRSYRRVAVRMQQL